MVSELRRKAHRRVVPQPRMNQRLSRSAVMRHALSGPDQFSYGDFSGGSGLREGRTDLPLEGQEEESPVAGEWIQAVAVLRMLEGAWARTRDIPEHVIWREVEEAVEAVQTRRRRAGRSQAVRDANVPVSGIICQDIPGPGRRSSGDGGVRGG